MLKDRQTSDTVAAPEDKRQRVNLLSWDGRGTPEGLFPPRDDGNEGKAT
jgi:nitrate reductase beta subunit